jgi:hypothetical protein
MKSIDGAEHLEGSRVSQRAQRVSSTPVLGFAVVLIVIFITVLLFSMETSTYDTWGGLLVGPVLFLISLPILNRQAVREGNRSLFWLLVAALVVKLGGALIFHSVAYDLYGGLADAVGYHEEAAELAEQFRVGDYDTGVEINGTNFIKYVAGALYTIIGTTKFGGYLFFSWLGFWGLFLFYRAFTIAVPEGRARTYARLVFFLPSLAFWPSAIGKEAWMLLALGIAAIGAARALSGRTWRGLLVAGLGMWMAAIVRPHIAALVGVALGIGYLFRKPRAELRQLAPISKALSMAVLAIVAIVVVTRAERFLRDSGVETERGVAGVQQSITTRTSEGGSYFAPSILRSPTQAPKAVLTVLFRPHPLEAHNSQALASSFENMFLLILTLIRIPWAIAALRSVRRQPYIVLAIAYTAMFIVAFSSFANFGNLVRQRVQVLPFFIALLCVPSLQREKAAAVTEDSSRWPSIS